MNSSQRNPWFACPRPNLGAEMRLSLFPYAGGGPRAFGKWPAELPATVDTFIMHYPCRSSRYEEPPPRRIDAFIENMSQAIRPFLDKPFAFFCHSLGRLVAYELARQLRRQDLPAPQAGFKARYFPGDHFFIHMNKAAVIAAISSEMDLIPCKKRIC